jgi:hypothetical protein
MASTNTAITAASVAAFFMNVTVFLICRYPLQLTPLRRLFPANPDTALIAEQYYVTVR